jgi:hypothetical protein
MTRPTFAEQVSDILSSPSAVWSASTVIGSTKELDDEQQWAHGRNAKRPRKTWRQVHEESAPLLLAVAHNALTACIIDLAGYPVYQIGGFALVGARFAYPDVDLAQFGENSSARRWAGRAGHQHPRSRRRLDRRHCFLGDVPPTLSVAVSFRCSEGCG